MANGGSSTPLILPDMVYIDKTNGVALVGSYLSTIIGTATLPVNNLADALTLAAQRLTNNFHIKNALALDRDVPGNNFFGDRDWGTSGVSLGGYDVTGCNFTGLQVFGSSPGYFTAFDCFVTDLYTSYAQINADLTNCHVGSIQPVPLTGLINCYNCTSQGYPYFVSLAGGGALSWIGGAGGVNLRDMDNAACVFYLDSINVGLYIASSCTLGTIDIGAVAYKFDLHPYTSALVIYDRWNFAKGKNCIITVNLTIASDYGLRVLTTAHLGRILIKSVVERAAGTTTPLLTSAGLYAANVTPGYTFATLIDPAVATQARLATVNMQVNSYDGKGPWVLQSGQGLAVNMVGTGSASVSLSFDIEYEPLVDNAYMGA